MTRFMNFDSGGFAPTTHLQDNIISLPFTAHETKDETGFTAASILRVLNGVAVATKAPDKYVQPLMLWIRRHGPVASIGLPSNAPASNAQDVLDRALPIDEWRALMASSPAICKPGIRQLTDITLAIALLREKSRRDLDVSPASLDTIWSLIKEAITSAPGTELQFTASRSAQGFIAVPLCSLVHQGRIEELYRFHVWLPDGERGMADVAVHSHQPFAQSWILAGRGLNRSFDVRSTDDYARATHATYALCFTDAQQQTGKEYKTHQLSSTVTNTGHLVTVTPLHDEELPTRRDMSYSVPGGAYHQSVIPAHAFHATLFFFDAHRGFVPDAGVTGPKDGRAYTQIRDPGGVTAQDLAILADRTRRREQQLEGRKA